MVQVKNSIIKTSPSVIIPSIVHGGQKPQQSDQTPQVSNQNLQFLEVSTQPPPGSTTSHSDFSMSTEIEGPETESLEGEVPIEYCNLGPIFEPFRFSLGEQSFKIDFDLRINLGRTNALNTVLVDCESPDYHMIFESQFMLRLINISNET